MTLQFLPPADVSPFEFDSDIKDGIRPAFLDEVSIIRTYSIVLKTQEIRF